MLASPETLSLFARFLSRHLGLYFPVDRLAELEQKLAPLAAAAQYADLDAYLLRQMADTPSREQLEQLAATLTIGETYFLRDPSSYQVLERELLPVLIAERRRANNRVLRLWSAGCSSGEEPYTLAMLLSRSLPDLAQWEISLLATDINPQALARGRHGIYSKWSFRNAPDWVMEYFKRRPDGRFQIADRLRRMVQFDYLNLAEEQAALPLPAGAGLDIIFCRNVMLYFEPSQIERTIARFHAALRPGGALFVGPTEVDHSLVPGFSCQRHAGAFVLIKELPGTPRKRVAAQPQALAGTARHQLPLAAPAAVRVAEAAAGAPTVAPPPASGPLKEAPPGGPPAAGTEAKARALYLRGEYRKAADCVRRAQRDAPQPASALALAARALANLGELEQARELCEAALAGDRLSATNHYLLALILEQQGELAGAAAALKNVLYLDHDNLLAYFSLGNLSRQAGEVADAERNFGTALRLLETRDPQEELPETEGLTAGGLAQMIKGMMQSRSAHG
jgi:chemotaxis protein methyltransferase CheR